MAAWGEYGKMIARKIAVGFAKEAADTALFTPSDSMRCVHAALGFGRITLNTQCIFVERDPMVMARLKKTAAKLGFNVVPKFIVSDLYDMPLSEFLEGAKLDFCFLDTCSSLSRKSMRWMLAELVPCLSREFVVSVTVFRSFRNCLDVPELYYTMQRMSAASVAAARRAVQRATWGGIVNEGEYPFDEVLAGADGLRKVPHVLDDKLLTPAFHESSVKNAVCAWLSLQGVNAQLTGCLEYGRHGRTKMGVLRFENGGHDLRVAKAANNRFLLWLAGTQTLMPTPRMPTHAALQRLATSY